MSEHYQQGVPIAIIENAVGTLRRRVSDNPDDMMARLDLAWNLFLLSVHGAEVERQRTAGGRSDVEPSRNGAGPPDGGTESINPAECCTFPQALIIEAVQHLSIVMELDKDVLHRQDIRRLEKLILLCGGATAAAAARSRITHHVDDIVQDVLA